MIYKLVRWRQYGPQKCCYFPTSPHGDTTDKTNMDMSIICSLYARSVKNTLRRIARRKRVKPTKLANSERSSFLS